MSPEKKLELINLIRQNNSKALNQLVDSSWEKLYAYAFKLTSDRELSQSIIQTIFIDLWDKRQKLEIAIQSNYIDTLITGVEAIIPDLAALSENSTYNGRFTKEAAYAILSEMYMNRAVFLNRYNDSSDFNFTEASVNNSSKTDMDMVIEYTSMLISSPKFELAPQFFDNFGIDNNDGPELIFVAPQNVNDGSVTGQNDFVYMPMERAQHESESGMRGTNATCTTPEYYATWSENTDDPRFEQKYQYADGTWFYNNQAQDIAEYPRRRSWNRWFAVVPL
ncbi:RNA polymerase sigma factor [Mangrovibacterium lignilyticum]|uniref:RNA polymerase sigma factor n=1 Tax=Mangrovibacterium lignilyticum TaxID=2668052 RepID=UPI0013CFE64F|nr:hypothetical protein [Mangrovibacterium lignilyticum]